ncbi:MAG: GAP family protein [Ilumatobacteraceae bacterium]
MIGVAGVLGVLIAIASSQELSNSDSGASTTSFWIRTLLGCLLFLGAYRQLQQRPADGAEPVQPKWMAGIASFTTGKSFTTGLVIGAVNPKNLAMSLAAAATISAAALSTGEDVSTVVVYALIGTAGVAAPLVVAVALGTRSTVILDGWKIWLAENNAAVMAVLFAVIGAVLVGKGISGLTA